ncbi:MAG: histidine kinase [Bacillota bacterium]
MVFRQAYAKVFPNVNWTQEIRLIVLCRFISLLITSFFFMISDTRNSTDVKIFIIICICISSILLSYLYIKNSNSQSSIKLLVLIEIIANSFILIPTGGINSPFVWYSLNTILITSFMFNKLYCWINLLVYLTASISISYTAFNNKGENIVRLISTESNLILSLFVITAIIRMLAMYSLKLKKDGQELKKINRELKLANEKVKEYIGYIMELYQAVHIFTTLNNRDDLIKLIIEYTGKITKTDLVFLYNVERTDEKRIAFGGSIEKETEFEIIRKISDIWDVVIEAQSPLRTEINSKNYFLSSIMTNGMVHGILGIEATQDDNYEEQLKFIEALSSIAFERLETERMNERLIITEEQNRIANEIHDSVLQRLFSTSFGIYTLDKRLNKLDASDISAELQTIRASVDNTMKELRAAIYGLSWKKDGMDNFVVDTINYINEIRKLNNVDISFKMSGNNEMLMIQQKKAIYRIICESIGNAVRHGKAKNIDVLLQISYDSIQLKVVDNGIGFDVNHIITANQGGVGIKNIRFLASSLGGKASITSNAGSGTGVCVTIPNKQNELKKEMVV